MGSLQGLPGLPPGTFPRPSRSSSSGARRMGIPAGSQLLLSAYGNGQSDDIHLPLRKRRQFLRRPTLLAAGPLNEMRIERGGTTIWQRLVSSTAVALPPEIRCE